MCWTIYTELESDYRKRAIASPLSKLKLLFFFLTCNLGIGNARSAEDSLTRPAMNDFLKIASGLLASGKTEQALKILEHLLEESHKCKNPDSLFIAEVLFQKANLFMILNDPDRSIPLYQSALRITKKARQRARLELNLGTAFFIREDYKRALMHFHHALSGICDSGFCSPGMYREIAYNLGCAYFEDGDQRSSEFWWQESDHITREAFPGDTDWLIRHQANLGNISFYSNNWNKACDNYHHALIGIRTSHGISSAEQAIIERNLARSYQMLQIRDSAILYINQARERAEQLMPPDTLLLLDLLNWQATLYRSFGMFEQSDSILERTLSRFFKPSRDTGAGCSFLFAVQRFKLLRDLSFIRYHDYIHSHHDAVKRILALNSLEQAVEQYEIMMRGNKGTQQLLTDEDSVSTMYKRAMEIAAIYYQKGSSDCFKKYRKLSSGLRLFENQCLEFSGMHDGIDDESLLEKEMTVKRKLYYLSKKRLEFGSQAITRSLPLENYYYNLTKQYDSLRAVIKCQEKSAPFSLPQARSASESLLDYTVTEQFILIRVISAGMDTLIIKENDPGLNCLVDQFMTALRTADQHQIRRTGSSLYQLLISPAWDLIEEKDKLVIIPDPMLKNIPFECFMTPAPLGSIKNHQENFLIRKFVISYSRTSEKPGPDRDNEADTGYLYALCSWSPQFSGEAEPESLSHAMNEVNDISDAFIEAGKNVVCYSGKTADERSFLSMSRNSRILHIATHGKPDPLNDERSGVLFSSGMHDYPADPLLDGILEMGELPGMRIRSELLVISSCKIQNGNTSKGDVMQFQPDMFLQTGVARIIYSLWNVTDRYTARLMVSFYRHYLSGECYASALRKAKLELLENPYTAAPAIWGGFILCEK